MRIPPVLLITFNRPVYVSKMIEALRKAKITNLYVFKDGPRPNNSEDYQASKEIERIIATIDWDCDVKINYMQNNLGCGYGPYSAISWAFQYVDELIILEDDCIPTIVFFEFCSQMLEKYRDNPKVRHISGRSQYSECPIFKEYDYIFSQYAPTWGWATWKRTWQNFDMQMRNLSDFFRKGGYSYQFSTEQEASFFNKRYYSTLKNISMVFHVWDFQYGLHSRIDGSLAIVPALNLIHYIGVEGTHPVEIGSDYTNLKSNEYFNISKWPAHIEFIPAYEQEYFKRFVKNKSLFWMIRNKIDNILKKFCCK